MINGAEVIITDIEASNGVIHVIDAVILPPTETAMEGNSILEIASKDGRFLNLVSALEKADLLETLRGEGAFTVFAPTDDAFAALPEGAMAEILGDKEALQNTMLYHVIEGKILASDVVSLDGQSAETLSGYGVPINVEDGKVMVGEAVVVFTDIEASNGVIHVIDAVLLPDF
jgi:uncharacterized surface protein with fasciclin (FAS1) repeats